MNDPFEELRSALSLSNSLMTAMLLIRDEDEMRLQIMRNQRLLVETRSNPLRLTYLRMVSQCQLLWLKAARTALAGDLSDIRLRVEFHDACQGARASDDPPSAPSVAAMAGEPEAEQDDDLLTLRWRKGEQTFSIVVSPSRIVGLRNDLSPPRTAVEWSISRATTPQPSPLPSADREKVIRVIASDPDFGEVASRKDCERLADAILTALPTAVTLPSEAVLGKTICEATGNYWWQHSYEKENEKWLKAARAILALLRAAPGDQG